MGTLKIGQRVWWKNPSTGREFYAEIRGHHPHADLSDYYELSAVFAENCSDMPDNWAHIRDIRTT